MSLFPDNLKKLGFGLMRLPMKDGRIDLELTSKMVDRFLEEGFLYFDTAYGYNNGDSERAVKTCICERHPRESFLLATKLPAWAGVNTKEEAEQMLYTSLERTGAGYFDYYLLHNLGEHRTKPFDDFGIWDFVQKKKTEGLIKHVGFSFHDKAEKLEEILKAHPEMEFVQLQINYADWEDPVIESRKCYELARKYGKPIIVMEPVKGGNLAAPPEDVTSLLNGLDADASAASWAIRYAASLEGVDVVLSGMSDMAQLEDNISYMKDFVPLTEKENEVMNEAGRVLAGYPLIPCTACAYCMKDCPKHIAIYGSFQAVNMYRMFGNIGAAKGKYN